MTRVLLSAFLVLVGLLSICSGFQLHPAGRFSKPLVSATALNGMFDKFVQGMEGNYKGDDSSYAKAKAADEQKALDQKKKSDARRARGYTELKDVKKRTFAKLKYGAEPEPEEKPEPPKKKNIFDSFFKK